MSNGMHEAFVAGLEQKFGTVAAEALEPVIGYFPSYGLSDKSLKKGVQDDAARIAQFEQASKIDGEYLLLVQSNIVASAMMKDRGGVMDWSQKMKDFCTQVDGGGWAGWEKPADWVKQNPDQYIELVGEIKELLHHR